MIIPKNFSGMGCACEYYRVQNVHLHFLINVTSNVRTVLHEKWKPRKNESRPGRPHKIISIKKLNIRKKIKYNILSFLSSSER